MMIKAKKEFGQNFLKDESVLSKIIQAIPKGTEQIVEIGVGLGDLTQRLLELARVRAYEIDDELIPHLRRKFQKQLENKSLELLNEDASKAFTPNLCSQNYVLVANLPYYIASKLVLQALRDSKCEAILVMVQKEVALKFCARAKTSDFCALSVLARLVSEPNLLFEVAPSCFEPAPKVSSAVMFLQKEREFKDICDISGFECFLKDCFKAPRKQLLSNLKAHKVQISRSLNELDIRANVRAHELSVKSFLEIYDKVKDYYERRKPQLAK